MFRLSEQDKETLLKWGYLEEEFQQIEKSNNVGTFEVNLIKNVSWQTAKKIVGRENFLSGISRAAFHWSSYRVNKSGTSVYFDFSEYFK